MCNDFNSMFKPMILVTGFGPDKENDVSASWEGVRSMDKEGIEDKHNVEFVQMEFPFTYKDIDEYLPALWETHTPALMIHVGVSGQATCFDLESQAHRKGYHKPDDFGECPPKNVSSDDGALRIQSKLDVARISKEFNDANPEEKTKTQVSMDAGRFLCEYIYYKSLHIDSTRTLFVHVPTLEVYSREQTARGLERIVELCLEQIHEREQLGLVSQLERTAIDENRL